MLLKIVLVLHSENSKESGYATTPFYRLLSYSYAKGGIPTHAYQRFAVFFWRIQKLFVPLWHDCEKEPIRLLSHHALSRVNLSYILQKR